MAGPILTPPSISTLPNGLMRYFGIQSGGAYPRSLEANYQLSIDEVLPIMAASTNTNSAVSVNANAAGVVNATGFVVSDSKLVRAELIGLRFATIAGEAITAGLVIVSANGVEIPLTGVVSIGASTGSQVFWSNGARPLYLQPGDQIAARVMAITTAGNIALNFSLRKSDLFF